MTAPILVAIDGPAGSGKSSVSRAAATKLGFGILDTGAAYRSLAWACIASDVDLDSSAAVTALLDAWTYDITLLGEQRVTVRVPGAAENGGVGDASGASGVGGASSATDVTDVTDAIRDPAISGQVSRVSKHAAVRERLNAMFRTIVAESGLPGVVIEGRDITTVVAPDAPVRILMTASPEVRATRRAGELPGLSHEQVLADINARDEKDAKVVDFLNATPGVRLIDTSDMNFEQSIQAVIDTVNAARAAEPTNDKERQ